MKETSDRYVRVLFCERQVKEILEFCFKRDICYVLKREIMFLIYKYVTPFTMVDNRNRDEMIAPYTTVDHKNCGDIQGQAYYVTINGKLLVSRFEPFHSRYLSLRLVPMTAMKYPLVNTKKSVQKRTNTMVNR
jgi:hypothetical protein